MDLVRRKSGIHLGRRLRQSASLFCTQGHNAPSSSSPSPSSSGQKAAEEQEEEGGGIPEVRLLRKLSFNPGISDRPISSPAVARFKRMAIAPEAQELLQILEQPGDSEQERAQKLRGYYGRLNAAIVVDVLTHLANVEAAVQFFNWCSTRPDYTHIDFTFNRFLELLVNKGHCKLAHQILLSPDKPFQFHPNSFTYATIVRGYCEAGELKQAMALMAHMKAANVTPNPKIYNILLTHLCKRGEERAALDLLRSMTDSCCQPDVFTYNILINALCKIGRLDDAEGVTQMMQAHGCAMDIVTFNTLIHGLCKGTNKGRVSRALQLFRDMPGKGFSRSTITFTIMIDALLRAKMDAEAQQLLTEMHESGCSFDLVTYNTLINRFAKNGIMDRAAELFLEMPSRGCVPDVVTYNSLLDGFCKADRIDEARRLFNAMARNGIVPNARTYTCLADALLKAGRMDEAEEFIAQLRDKGLADGISYVAMISSIAKLGKGKRAFELLKEMIAKGFRPNIITLNAVFQALGREQDVDEQARSAVQELQKQEIARDKEQR